MSERMIEDTPVSAFAIDSSRALSRIRKRFGKEATIGQLAALRDRELYTWLGPKGALELSWILKNVREEMSAR